MPFRKAIAGGTVATEMEYFLILHPLLLLAAIIITGAERAAIYPVVDYESQSQSEDGKVPLYVGLIQSYDPSSPDAQLDSTGTIVGTEIALDHINEDESMLPGYRLHYSFVGSPVRVRIPAYLAYITVDLNPADWAASVAQLAEHWTNNLVVTGSNPVRGS